MQLNHIMSNILIIKHGSLGDLIQANGAIKDIRENFPNDKIILLTTPLYIDLMSHCPYIDGTLIDKRLPRWNIFYLLKLKNMLDRFSFIKVFDLQNSSRTKFYRNFFFKKIFFSSSETSLDSNEKKSDFDKFPVLDRMKIQLEKAGLKTSSVLKPDLSWAIGNVKNIINQNFDKKYILLFPFSSPGLKHKQWPHYKDLIKLLIKNFGDKYSIAIAPGPGEVIMSREYNVITILNKDKPVNLIELIGLINGAIYIVSNDTGPGHIASHLKKKGLALFGSHTSAEKVSIENENFKCIQTKKLKNLPVADVFEKIQENLN